MGADNEYILEMEGISKSFPGVQALDNVTVRIRPASVHALMGENGAGKSTLMKCLFGIYSPDAGKIRIQGKDVAIHDPHMALDFGLSMIHQELNPIPHMPVMENVWLGRYPVSGYGPFKLISPKKMIQQCKDLFKEFDIQINPQMWVSKLSVSKIQQMEIAKAVSYNSKVIIMDEPTSSLTETEVKHLFWIIRGLVQRGVAVIYISHKLEEILEISDEVTIMRDGKVVSTNHARDLTPEVIIKQMVGRDLQHRFPPRSNVPGKVVMQVNKYTSATEGSFVDVSFDLREGEILGIGGLVGAQRTELVESIFGLRNIASGSISIRGRQTKIHNPIIAKRNGMALLTEERRATGLFPLLSVFDNTIMANLDSYLMKFVRLLNRRKSKRDVDKSIEQLRVKTPNSDSLIRDLSGGNQQKVIFARWLLTNPEILILDEPTRGIDVGAKYEIYSIIADLAKRGKSIIMISSEMPELLGMSDRILVMCEGRLTGILGSDEATQEKILELATKFM